MVLCALLSTYCFNAIASFVSNVVNTRQEDFYETSIFTIDKDGVDQCEGIDDSVKMDMSHHTSYLFKNFLHPEKLRKMEPFV